MNVIFIEPAFPYDQREFVRGLHAVGARVIGIEAGYMANAWMRVRHPDYDRLRYIMNSGGLLRVGDCG